MYFHIFTSTTTLNVLKHAAATNDRCVLVASETDDAEHTNISCAAFRNSTGYQRPLYLSAMLAE